MRISPAETVSVATRMVKAARKDQVAWRSGAFPRIQILSLKTLSLRTSWLWCSSPSAWLSSRSAFSLSHQRQFVSRPPCRATRASSSPHDLPGIEGSVLRDTSPGCRRKRTKFAVVHRIRPGFRLPERIILFGAAQPCGSWPFALTRPLFGILGKNILNRPSSDRGKRMTLIGSKIRSLSSA